MLQKTINFIGRVILYIVALLTFVSMANYMYQYIYETLK
jgi:hypothetical protein